MPDKSRTDLNKVLSDLNDMKEESEKEWDDDVIKRTISSLLSIEKKALYGSLRNKAKQMDVIVLAEMKNNKEKVSVTKKD